MSKVLMAAVCLSMVLSVTTFADVVSVDWHNAGDGLLTRDTIAGVEWLDITLTYNRARSEVAALTGTGGQFEGFRWATAAEFYGLHIDAGIPTSTGLTDAGMYAATQSLQRLLGYSNEFSNTSVTNYVTAGFLSDPSQFGLIATYDFLDGQPDQYRAESYGVVGTFTAPYVGIWLLRNTPTASTPLPAAAPAGLALIGATGLKRNRRKISA